jgi:cytochrome P450
VLTVCAGAHPAAATVASQEAKIALARLYQQYTFELEAGQVPLKVRQNLTLGPADGVFVRCHKRA